MFDRNQNIDISIPSPDGTKKVTVRFPSDDELIERMARQKTVVQPIPGSRGKTTTETLNAEEVNFQLFQKIRLEGSAEVDEWEATHIFTELTRCEPVDAQRTGSGFVITVSVPGSETVHYLNTPSMKQVMQYRRKIVSVQEGRRGNQEIRFNLKVAGDLYDSLVENTEGYEGEVPIVHKSPVISEMLAIYDTLCDDRDTKGF